MIRDQFLQNRMWYTVGLKILWDYSIMFQRDGLLFHLPDYKKSKA